MRFRMALALACALGVTLGAQAFDVKTGQWMFTVTATTLPPAPSSLPPDVAAKIMANARRPHNVPACISADDLRNFRLGKIDEDEDQKNCTVTSRKSTATTADFVRTCKGDEPGTETVHVEAASRESFTMTVKRVAPNGPGEFNIAAKWTGAACKDN